MKKPRAPRAKKDKAPAEPPHAAAVRDLAAKESDPAAKDYLESALHNHDGTPEDLVRQLADQSQTKWVANGQYRERTIPPAAHDAMRRAMLALGAEEQGPEAGATVPWDPARHQPPHGEPLSAGTPVRVVRRPVTHNGKLVGKGEVEAANNPEPVQPAAQTQPVTEAPAVEAKPKTPRRKVDPAELTAQLAALRDAADGDHSRPIADVKAEVERLVAGVSLADLNRAAAGLGFRVKLDAKNALKLLANHVTAARSAVARAKL